MNTLGVAMSASGPEFRLDREQFERLVEPLVPALRLHCYRLLGSLDDAEDTVQETLIRAWRRRDRLAEPSGLRPWLFRIATNASLDLLDRRRRRPTVRIVEEAGWPDPVPNQWLNGADGGDPADVFLRRESVGLAFMAAVQLLPPRQRAILVLRDVLEWSAADVAEALETTSAAVNSGLERARAAIRARLPADRSASFSATTPDARDVARRYLDAWERADTTSLARLLTVDARMAMPPDPRTFEGPAAIVGYLETAIFSVAAGRRISLQPTLASGQPAFVVLEPDETTGEGRRIGVMVLTVQGGRVAEIRGYMRADLAARFDGSQRSAQDVWHWLPDV
jgi:RNA polymerase sigma-70 factor (ECF subfamily)